MSNNANDNREIFIFGLNDFLILESHYSFYFLDHILHFWAAFGSTPRPNDGGLSGESLPSLPRPTYIAQIGAKHIPLHLFFGN